MEFRYEYWHISDSSDIVSILLRTFYGKAYLDYSALSLNLAEKIKLKKEEKKIETSKRVKISSSAEAEECLCKGRNKETCYASLAKA